MSFLGEIIVLVVLGVLVLLSLFGAIIVICVASPGPPDRPFGMCPRKY